MGEGGKLPSHILEWGGITSSPQIASSSVVAHIELSHLIYVANLKSRLSKGQFILEVECIA